MKYFLIMNPMSQGGKSLGRFKKIFTLLDAMHLDYTYELTKSLEHARLLSKKANESNFDVVVAVGGDGTINSVISGFYDGTGNRTSSALMGVIYTGTSPDFCKSYNIPLNINKATHILADPHVRKIKIGKISYCEKNLAKNHGKRLTEVSGVKTGYFGCCVNVGLGPLLARAANSGIRKYLGDKAGTFVSLIKILLAYKADTLDIIRDDTEREINKLYNISIGITPFIASGIQVNHDLTDNDERFYCMIAKNLKFYNIPDLLYTVYSGRKIKNSGFLSLDYCKTLEIPGNYQHPEFEADGDPVGYLPLKIELSKSRLELITGRGG